MPGCVGIEYGERRQRCEVWTRPNGIQSSVQVIGYNCWRYQAGGTTTPRPIEFQPVKGEDGNGQVCRGPQGESDNSPSYYSVLQAGSLDECKRLCGSSPTCTGVEWWSKRSRCEVWHEQIGTSKKAEGFTCLRAVGLAIEMA